MSQQSGKLGSRKAFVEWLRKHIQKRGTLADSHTSLVIHFDPLSWHLWAEVVSPNETSNGLSYTFPLPKTLKEAREVWDYIQEQHSCIFLYAQLRVHGIVVAIRRGLWQLLEDRLLPVKRGQFHEVDFDTVETMLRDSQQKREVFAEVQTFGISCRIVLPPGNS